MAQSRIKQTMKEAIKSSWIYKFVVWVNDKILKPIITYLKGGLKNMPEEDFEEIEGDLSCSYPDALGRTLNDCEDFPVTYCRKCKRFYVLLPDGSREEIMTNTEEEYTE